MVIRRIKAETICFCIVVSILSLFFHSCKTEVIEDVDQKQFMSVSDYAYLGELHNSFMSNIHENYYLSESISTKTDLFKDITAFNLQHALKCLPSIENDQLNYFAKFECFLDSDAFSKYCMTRATRSDDIDFESLLDNVSFDEGIPSLDCMLQYLHDSGCLDDYVFNMLNEIVDLVIYSIEGQISDANFERCIDEMIAEFDASNYPVDDYCGALAASVLAISRSSLDWWKENPDAIEAEDKVLPPVVAADIGGAITGAVIDGIIQGGKIISGCADKWDWASTGLCALGGAVDGSLGISAKVGSYVLKFFTKLPK